MNVDFPPPIPVSLQGHSRASSNNFQVVKPINALGFNEPQSQIMRYKNLITNEHELQASQASIYHDGDEVYAETPRKNNLLGIQNMNVAKAEYNSHI